MTTKEQQGRLVLEACTGMHGDVAKELSLMLCAALDKQTDYASRLKEVNAWAVCAPIAYLGDSPEVAKAIHELCDAHNRAVAVTYKAAP